MVKIGGIIELIQTEEPITNFKRGDKETVTGVNSTKSGKFIQIMVK